MYRVLILNINLLERRYASIQFIAMCYMLTNPLIKGLGVKLFGTNDNNQIWLSFSYSRLMGVCVLFEIISCWYIKNGIFISEYSLFAIYIHTHYMNMAWC